MDCEHVRSLIGPFIDDELDVEATAEINGHIANCLQCQDEWTALTVVRSRLHALRPELEPPPDFMQRLRDSVELRRRAAKRLNTVYKSSYMVPIAAAAAALIGLAPYLGHQGELTHTAGTRQRMSVS